MTDIKSPKLLWLKGGLFVFLGLLCLVIVWLRTNDPWLIPIVCLAIWAFARAYYFAFYVIEHYIDPSFKFAGLMSVVRYLLRKN